MNIKETIKMFESKGFKVTKSNNRWAWRPEYEAKKAGSDGNGISVSFQFDRQRGNLGKPLVEAITHCFPLMDGKRGILAGAKARDFGAGREVSTIAGNGCVVRTNGCTSARFEGGRFLGKF